MRVRAAVFGVVALGLVSVATLAIPAVGAVAHLPWLAISSLWPIFVATLLLIYPVFFSPGRRFRAWGYHLSADELHLKRGVMTQQETIVPLGRVQHIDVGQGPLERACGVTHLVLHTAGTAQSSITLPGLKRETAEALRDEIRQHIRQDLDAPST